VQDHARRLKAEVIRLEGQLDSLERDWRRLPRLLTLLVLTVPIALAWDVVAAVLFGIGVVIMTGVGAYLVSTRKGEYKTELESVRRDLRHVQQQARDGRALTSG
jgi:hypothetical protein